jgi:CRP-like cAMP-binding protein
MPDITSADLSTITTALLKSGYPDADLSRIRERLAGLKLRKCAPGELLIKEGDNPGDAYILHNGFLEVFKHTGGGKDAKIAEVSPGSLVGEMALLTGFARTATVKAKAEVELFVLTPKDFHMLIHESPGFKTKVELLVEERKRALAKV